MEDNSSCQQESKWMFYARHILDQLKALWLVTGKVHPECRQAFYCQLSANLDTGTLWLWQSIINLFKHFKL